MKFFSPKTFFEIASELLVNLAAGWLGALLIVPGFVGVLSIKEYFQLLTVNLPFGILALIFALLFSEKGKSL